MDFDWSFLKCHTEIIGATMKKNCTLLLARKKKFPVLNNKLETLCNYYNIKSERFHSALEDAKAVGDLFLQLHTRRLNNGYWSTHKTKKT